MTAVHSQSRAGAPWRPWLLAACLVALTRFWHLGSWSLWYDEALTLADGWHGSDLSNPLGYALVRAAAALWGETSPLALRLPAALAGWLAVPLTFWAFRGVAGDRRAALAALLLALSPWALYWSQNARFYTMALALGLAGTGLFLRGMKRGSTPRAGIALALVCLAALFHPTAILLALALLGAGLVAGPGEVRRVAARLALIALPLALLAVPWGLHAVSRWMAAKDTAGPGSALHLALSTGFLLTPPLALAAAVGTLTAWRSRHPSRWLLLVPILGGSAAALAALLAASSAQYVFVLLPLVALAAVWPFAEGPPLARTAWPLLLAAPLASGSVLYFTSHHGERPRWEEAYRFAWERRGEGDLLLGMQASVGEYYLAPGTTDLRHPTTVAWLERTQSHAWKRWAERERPLWIVLRPAFLALWKPEERSELERFLREHCRLMKRFPISMEGRDLDLEVYYRGREE